MGYLNESGLARYDGLVKNWVTFKSGTVDGIDPLLNWQKTETAASVTCYPLPAAPIDPTVNFLFTETGPAFGTKGPDNPSTITGVSQAKMTRCGKNLLPSIAEGTTSSHGVTFVVASDGSVSVSGAADANAQISIPYVELRPGTYFLSGCPSGGSDSSFYLGAQGGRYDTGNGKSFTLTKATRVYFWIQVVSGTAISTPIVFKPQLELGSVATSFEPYEGADYTVNLGNTYYGGSIDLATGVMTVTHSLQELTTNSPYAVGLHDGVTTFEYKFSRQNETTPAANATCSHFNYTAGWSSGVDGWHLSKTRVYFDSTTITSGTDFSAWVTQQKNAGTPVVFTFMLENPFTIQLTPTQIYSLSQPDPYTPRINTVYSDQQSVQVGYPKSPQATAAELTNAIISLGGNV